MRIIRILTIIIISSAIICFIAAEIYGKIKIQERMENIESEIIMIDEYIMEIPKSYEKIEQISNPVLNKKSKVITKRRIDILVERKSMLELEAIEIRNQLGIGYIF